MQGLQRDVKYHEEKVRECEKKIRQLEHNMSEEVQLKERARLNLQVPIQFASNLIMLNASSQYLQIVKFHLPSNFLVFAFHKCSVDIPCVFRQDFVRRLAHALSVEYCETAHHSPEMVIHKAEELVQDVNRLRTKSTNVETQLTGVEVDFRTCRDALDRATTEKEQLQRQLSVHLVDVERLRQVM